MPFFHDGTYYLFHQRDTRNPEPFGEPFGWSLVTTTDFVTFTDHGEALVRGGDDDQDQFIFAGSVMHGPDRFLAFYTGYNRDFPAQGRASQVLMLAESDDLITWRKSERAIAAPLEGYDPDDWRDPYVVWDSQHARWLLILGSRHAGAKTMTSGTTVAFSSKDLVEWTYEGDLWAPGLFTMHEMPDLFELNGRWYLLTTEYSAESKTIYSVSESIEGPWPTPFDDAFDGRAYYAARSAGSDTQRCLFGWIPTKEGDDDRALWQWGGALVVHEIASRPDGTLGVRSPETVREAFGASRELVLSNTTITSVDTVETLALGDVDSETYRLVVDLRFAAGTSSIGLRFAQNAQDGLSYRFDIAPERRRLSFDRRPSFPWPRYENRGLERPIVLDPGADHRLELLVEGSIAVLYLDDVALTVRAYERTGSGLALDVFGGEVRVLAASLQQR